MECTEDQCPRQQSQARERHRVDQLRAHRRARQQGVCGEPRQRPDRARDDDDPGPGCAVHPRNRHSPVRIRQSRNLQSAIASQSAICNPQFHFFPLPTPRRIPGKGVDHVSPLSLVPDARSDCRRRDDRLDGLGCRYPGAVPSDERGRPAERVRHVVGRLAGRLRVGAVDLPVAVATGTRGRGDRRSRVRPRVLRERRVPRGVRRHASGGPSRRKSRPPPRPRSMSTSRPPKCRRRWRRAGKPWRTCRPR